jgi:hypothetical protein
MPVQVCTEIPLPSLFIFPFHSGLLKVDKRVQHKSNSAVRLCFETITTAISVNLCRSFESFLSFNSGVEISLEDYTCFISLFLVRPTHLNRSLPGVLD